jgi:hypothetical protein
MIATAVSWQYVAEHLLSFAFGVIVGLGLCSRGYRIVKIKAKRSDDAS